MGGSGALGKSPPLSISPYTILQLADKILAYKAWYAARAAETFQDEIGGHLLVQVGGVHMTAKASSSREFANGGEFANGSVDPDGYDSHNWSIPSLRTVSESGLD